MKGLLRRFLSPGPPGATPPAAAAAAPAPPPARLHDPRRLEALVPPMADTEARVAMATRCRDCDPVPKVAGAGRVEALPDGRRVQVMHNGLRVLADGYYGAWMTDLIARCGGHHEPQEERAFHEVVSRLPPGGAMLELGGFWAYYSAWFLAGDPARRALLVEPDPAHAEVGRANLALNGLADRAEFVPGFVGAYADAAPGEARAFPTEESGTLDLPRVDLAALLASRGLDRLAILHCDAQGAEFAVLEEVAPLLRAGRVDWACVSTHHHVISGDPLTHQRCLALLRALGASIEAEHDVSESYSGDGLILARFGPAPPGWAAPRLSHNRASESLFRHPLHDLAAATAPRLPPPPLDPAPGPATVAAGTG